MLPEDASDDDREVLVATVRRAIYRAGADGFAVLVVEPERGGGQAIAVGQIGTLDEGDLARMIGRWMEHPRFGRQFRVEMFHRALPDTTRGVEAYLSRLPKIGPGTAARIVEHFGPQALDILAEEPARVREVPGIGGKRARTIGRALRKNVKERELMVFLQGLGIPLGLAQRIRERYGDGTMDLVQSDPYRLAEDIRGVGFRTADRIARALGIPRDHPGRLRAGLVHVLDRSEDDGHLYLPRTDLLEQAAALLDAPGDDVEDGLAALLERGALTEIPDTEGWLGRPENLRLERGIAERIARAPHTHAAQPTDEELAYAERALGLQLDEAQREAIAIAIRHPVAVVTGGPGTGKTTLLRGTLALLQRRGLNVALAAPTGRAARRLSETTGARAKTLHRLLEFSPKEERFLRNRDRPIEADAVVVDEVSMVDVPLMAALCDALQPECSLLLVGDADQLPSVGPGLVLRDVLASEAVPVIRLQHVYRQAGGSAIVANAHRILGGELPSSSGTGGELSDFYVLHLDEPEDIRNAVEAMVARRIPTRFGLDPRTDIQVLVPMHRGALGAEAFNTHLQELLNPTGRPVEGRAGLRVGDRVIQTKNDYDLDLANGDVGIVRGPGTVEGAVIVRFERGDVQIPSDRQESLRLAYALSIHKSQGSEYPAVIVPLHTQHYVMLRRNLLYTAVTRGRKLVVLVGSGRAIRTAVRRNDAIARYTRLADLIAEPGS